MIITKDIRTEILERLKTQELVQMGGSEADYLELAHGFPFKIEYHKSEIYTMGLTSFNHEALCLTIGAIIFNLLFDNDEFTVLGSNAGVQIPKFEGGYYMPDVMVVKGEPQFKPNSTAIITNPYLIVEVLSPATDKFDTESKLPEYKHLTSLQQIIFVNQHQVGITSYIRTDKPNTWINQDFYALEEEMLIANQLVSLASIYKKVKF